MSRRGRFLALLVLLASLALGATPASAYRPLLSEEVLKIAPPHTPPPPEGEIEDACGLAIAPGGDIYVSDYQHRTVDVFSGSGEYDSQILLPGGPFSGIGINGLDAVCGLAFGSGGALYANEWHQAALRLTPTEAFFDEAESTAIATDAAGNLYVDDRTYVAVYEPSGDPVEVGGEPLRIGLGSLTDAYGLAVSASGAKVYVADAATDTVEVYEPAVSATAPQATISHGFVSLTDGALAVDPTDGHLLVLDNLQPGYEHPQAAIDEFEGSAPYAFLGQIKGPPGNPIVDGEPSGLAVDPTGNLYVTSGNSEGANVFKYGPDPPGNPPPAMQAAPAPAPAGDGAATPSTIATAAAAGSAATTAQRRPKRSGASASEIVQRGRVRVAVQASIAPQRLPRSGTAPIHFSLAAKIDSTDGSVPPQLRGISIEINRQGQINPNGLPSCSFRAIQPSTTAGALAACRRSLVGEGRFTAKVLVPQQAPFPSNGKIVAFNGRWHGRPAILAHVYGQEPVPTSYTLPFVIGAAPGGTYGTVLTASLPSFTSKWGYVTGISLELGRSYRSHGTSRSYLTAGCPAPAGFPGTTFPLSRATLSLAGHKPISQILTRSCTAR